MKTISMTAVAAFLTCLAIEGAQADHHRAILLSPKQQSIQISTVCCSSQAADNRDLARERSQLVSGKRYEHQPLVVAKTGKNDPNLTAGMIHTGKRTPSSAEQFHLAPIKSK